MNLIKHTNSPNVPNLVTLCDERHENSRNFTVKIDDVFFHCAKAVIRSKLWDPKTPIQRSEFPTYGEIVRDQRAPDAAAAAAAAADINADLQNDYKTRLY